ncbi:MAG: hypothetical protein AAGA18_15735 [Verrucomicrobiota bacterium]
MQKWKNLGGYNPDESKIVEEANWLIEAQSYLARRDHNATVYFDLQAEDVHLSMSNVTQVINLIGIMQGQKLSEIIDSIDPIYSDQPKGICYQTDDPANLLHAFLNIASKIALKYTE